MAMICKECGGIIPDVMFNRGNRNDCKNHTKPEINIDHSKPRIVGEKDWDNRRN